MAHPADIDMEDILPPRPRGYIVPNPPQIPFDLDNYGRPILEHWSVKSRDFTAKLNEDKAGFDVRRFNNADPTGEGKFHPHEWPAQYRLGPPGNMPDFNPLIEKYGLQVLNAAGFINCNRPAEAQTQLPHGRAYRNRNPAADENQRIHPILRYECWSDTPHEVWNLIFPSLVLATALLDDPSTLCYFYALSRPTADMDVRWDPIINADCRILDVPHVLTPQQQVETFNKLLEVRNYFNWRFGDMELWEHGSLALTLPMEDAYGSGDYIPASGRNTRQSAIIVSDQYVKVLRVYRDHAGDPRPFYNINQRFAGIPPQERVKIDMGSAHYRATVMLAITIIHEFAHVFNMAFFDCPPPFRHPREPFVRGSRGNEQGCSLENYLLGGSPHAIQIEHIPLSHATNAQQLFSVPFGFCVEKTWDQWLFHVPDFYMAVMNDVNKNEFVEPICLYPVPAEWATRLFIDQMWNEQVPRFGLEAVKIPKIKEWEVMKYKFGVMGLWGTGEERWNTGERIITAPNWV